MLLADSPALGDVAVFAGSVVGVAGTILALLFMYRDKESSKTSEARGKVIERLDTDLEAAKKEREDYKKERDEAWEARDAAMEDKSRLREELAGVKAELKHVLSELAQMRGENQ